jgi:hypothetical protein
VKTAAPENLWLLPVEALHDRSVTHALLYPAIEFKAMAYVSTSNQSELDPFERAVFGACHAGVNAVHEQADLLGLHPDFVGHLQLRLEEREYIDSRGVVRPSRIVDDERAQVVVYLYWDPHMGRLWPRYATGAARRPVAVSRSDSRQSIEAGDDGDPFTIAAFNVPAARSSPDDLAIEDCLGAVTAWSRDLRRLKRRDEALAQPALVLLDEQREVKLCAPSHHVTGSRAIVQDPFGGPQWPHMLRALSDMAQTNSGLRSWLQLDSTNGTTQPESHSDSDVQLMYEELADQAVRAKGLRSEQAEAQIRLDLIDLAHRLLDHLERRAERTFSARPQLASAYRDRAATMFGFGNGVLVHQDSNWAPGGAIEGLADRLQGLLDVFEPTVPGPLHRVAETYPELLSAGRGPNRELTAAELLRVCSALSAGLRKATNASEESPTLTGDQG